MLERFENWLQILSASVFAAKMAQSNWVEPEHLLVGIFVNELSWFTERAPDKNIEKLRVQIKACYPRYEKPVGDHRPLAHNTKIILAETIKSTSGAITTLHVLATLLETENLHQSFKSVLTANGITLEAVKAELDRRSDVPVQT